MDPSPNPVEILFSGAIRQDIARAATPPGSFWVTSNARRRMPAQWGKAFAYSDVTTTTYANVNLAGTPHFIAELAGNQILGTNNVVYSRPSSTARWVEVGKVARYRPIRSDIIAQTNVVANSPPLVKAATSALQNSSSRTYAAAIWSRVTGGTAFTARITIRDVTAASPGTVVFQYALSTDVYRPRVVAVGDYFVFSWQTAAGAVLAFSYSTVTGAISTLTSILTLFNASDRYDVVAASDGSTTKACFVGRTAANTMSVKLCTASSMALIAQTFALANNAITYPTVYGHGTSGGIWVVYAQPAVSTTKPFGAILSNSLAFVVVTETALVAMAGDITKAQIGIISRTSSSVWLVFGVDYGGAITKGGIEVHPIENDLTTVTGVFPFYSCWPASKPAESSSTGVGLWVVFDDVTTSDDIDRRVAFMRMDNIYSPSVIVEPSVGAMELVGTSISHWNAEHLGEVATTGSGDSERKWFSALSNLRADSGSATLGVELFCYESTQASTRTAALKPVRYDGTLYIPGGVVQEVNGDAYPSSTTVVPTSGVVRLGVENNFLRPPTISAALVAGGSLTSGGTYQYTVVWEWLDTLGKRHRSSPSNIAVSAPSAGNLTTRLTINGIYPSDRNYLYSGSLCATMWRTANGGSTFQRLATLDVENYAITSAASFTYDDTGATTITANEILYVQSQTSFPNKPAPACRFAWLWDGRLCVGGLWDANGFEVSRRFRPGQPAEFTRAVQFQQRIPEPLTAGASMDGVNVLFSEDRIYVQYGQGPSDDGRPALPVPQQIPSDVGCVNPRSLLEVPAGLIFQSKRGLMLLPRGLGPVQPFGNAIQDSLSTESVLGVAVQDIQNGRASERTAVFGLSTTLLVADLDTLEWISVDDSPAIIGTIGSWSGKVAIAASNQATSPGISYTNTSSFANTMSLTTGDIILGSGEGRYLLQSVYLRGELRTTDASGTLSINPQLDTYLDGVYSSVASSQTLPANVAGTLGDRVLLQYDARKKRVNSTGFKISVTGQTNAALAVHAIGLEAAPLPGPAGLIPNRRAS